MKKILIFSLALCAAALSCGCSSTNSESSDNGSVAEQSSSQTETVSSESEETEEEAESSESEAAEGDSEAEGEYTLLADFSQGPSEDFYSSDGWSNGLPFNCSWIASNCVFEDGVLKMSINEAEDGSYTGAEHRTNEMYGYGLYEVSMKPAKNVGIISSFFTYTGPTDGNPLDEIDIEFLGKDTTQVQFNYYTNGSAEGHEYLYDLGFDASEDFHTYGFRWEEDKITWYVDGEAVYEATEDIPTTPGRIMMNVWNGIGVDDWIGAYDGTTPLTAEYQWVRFTAEE